MYVHTAAKYWLVSQNQNNEIYIPELNKIYLLPLSYVMDMSASSVMRSRPHIVLRVGGVGNGQQISAQLERKKLTRKVSHSQTSIQKKSC